MTIKIHDAQEWTKISGKIKLPEVKQRRVRFDVNCESETHFYAKVDGNEYFIGKVDGRETIDFTAVGEVTIKAEGGPAWYRTTEINARQVNVLPEKESFVKVANRKERNPQLELMMLRMNQNMEKRMKQMELDHAKQLERIAAGQAESEDSGDAAKAKRPAKKAEPPAAESDASADEETAGGS